MKDYACENEEKALPFSEYGFNEGNTQVVPVDIEDVKIDLSLCIEERIRSYVQQIKDPYQFRCKGMVVRIAFSDTDETIEDRLEAYIRLRKTKLFSCNTDKSGGEGSQASIVGYR